MATDKDKDKGKESAKDRNKRERRTARQMATTPKATLFTPGKKDPSKLTAAKGVRPKPTAEQAKQAEKARREQQQAQAPQEPKPENGKS